jgi:hypothetical protein
MNNKVSGLSMEDIIFGLFIISIISVNIVFVSVVYVLSGLTKSYYDWYSSLCILKKAGSVDNASFLSPLSFPFFLFGVKLVCLSGFC